MIKKIKLPRKRKKAYMKVRGRNNYLGLKNSFLPLIGSSILVKEMRPGIGANGKPIFIKEGRW